MSHIRVKICGLTNLEDARVALEAGADLLGFIFYPKSPRYVAPEMVAEIVRVIREQRPEKRTENREQRTESTEQRAVSSLRSPVSHLPKFVGVFVNETADRVSQILAQTGLDYAQLHGNETPEMVAQFKGRAFKALRPASGEEAFTAVASFAPLGPSAGPSVMIDAYDPHLYGGTGKTADWRVAAALAQQHPGLLLAGSLTPENVAAAIQIARPWGVDVSSGVEAAPGRKDHGKVQAFLEIVKQAGG